MRKILTWVLVLGLVVLAIYLAIKYRLLARLQGTNGATAGNGAGAGADGGWGETEYEGTEDVAPDVGGGGTGGVDAGNGYTDPALANQGNDMKVPPKGEGTGNIPGADPRPAIPPYQGGGRANVFQGLRDKMGGPLWTGIRDRVFKGGFPRTPGPIRGSTPQPASSPPPKRPPTRRLPVVTRKPPATGGSAPLPGRGRVGGGEVVTAYRKLRDR